MNTSRPVLAYYATLLMFGAKRLGDFEAAFRAAGGNNQGLSELAPAIEAVLTGLLPPTQGGLGYPLGWLPSSVTSKDEGPVIAAWLDLLSSAHNIGQVNYTINDKGLGFVGLLPFLAFGEIVNAMVVGSGVSKAQATLAVSDAEAGKGLKPSNVVFTPHEDTQVGSMGSALGVQPTPLIVPATGTATATSAGLSALLGKLVQELSGSSTAGNITSSITSGIGGLITDFEHFISPVTNLVSNVLTGINTLDTKYIEPLAGTISKDYNTINGLIGEIHTLSQSGIQGILAIPHAIGSAFSALQIANTQLAQAVGAINEHIAAGTLVPGIGTAIAKPLADIHAILGGSLGQGLPDVGELTGVQINQVDFNYEGIKGLTEQLIAQAHGHGFWGDLFGFFAALSQLLFALVGLGETLLSYSRQAGRQANPVEPLDIGSVISAWWRGQLSPDQAIFEISRHGLDSTRATLLRDLRQWLPDLSQALQMFYRGVIDPATFNGILSKQGFNKEDIQAVLFAALEPIDPREAILANGRIAAYQQGFLKTSLGSPLPEEYRKLYPPKLRNVNQGDFDWVEHWKIEDIHWWITAFFRKLITREEVYLAATAHNIPPETIDKLIEVDSEVVQLWMIPDMLASGILTEAEATDYMAFIGMDPKSAAIIIKYGFAKAKKSPGQLYPTLTGITAGVAKKMFEDGVINESEYQEVLTEHGYSIDAAVLTVKLAKLELDLTSRKNYANELIDQVLQGLLSETAFRTDLYNRGFTTSEVDGYVAQLGRKAQQTQKKLSNTDIHDFLKAGIFTQDEAFSALRLGGWSVPYATAFIMYWTGAPYAAPTS